MINVWLVDGVGSSVILLIYWFVNIYILSAWLLLTLAANVQTGFRRYLICWALIVMTTKHGTRHASLNIIIISNVTIRWCSYLLSCIYLWSLINKVRLSAWWTSKWNIKYQTVKCKVFMLIIRQNKTCFYTLKYGMTWKHEITRLL